MHVGIFCLNDLVWNIAKKSLIIKCDVERSKAKQEYRWTKEKKVNAEQKEFKHNRLTRKKLWQKENVFYSLNDKELAI